MPHEIRFDEAAEETFRSFDNELKIEIAIRLSSLSDHPLELSRPSPTPPYPPGFQLYDFTHVDEGKRLRISFLFQFDEPEILIVRRIGIVHLKDRS